MKLDQVMEVELKKYNNLLASGRWSKKDPKDDHILAISGGAQKQAYDSMKSSNKSNTSNRESINEDPYDIRDLSPWMMEERKV